LTLKPTEIWELLQIQLSEQYPPEQPSARSSFWMQEAADALAMWSKLQLPQLIDEAGFFRLSSLF
jgi:hypothetical protein